MPIVPPTGRAAARALAVAALLASGLGGCKGLGSALGGGGGVMPATEVGPPPSMRDAIPGKQTRSAAVDDEGRPLQTSPTRQLALPKSAGGASRGTETTERRIRREDLEGSSDPRGSGSSMGPMMSSGGGVGLGGKF